MHRKNISVTQCYNNGLIHQLCTSRTLLKGLRELHYSWGINVQYEPTVHTLVVFIKTSYTL